jgi:hypothetical protein
MPELSPALLHFIWLIPLALLAVYIGSPRFRGSSGQIRTRRLLTAQLQHNQYTVFSDLIIPAGGGTVHLDQLVVSQFGVFVIDTENRSGKISGTEFQDRWKQYRFGRFTRFDNPVHLNVLAINALARHLQLPPDRFHSIVAFSGSNSFSDQMPANVIPVERLISVIRSHSKKVLTYEESNRILKQVREDMLRSRGGIAADRWSLLRFVLVLVVIVGGWFVFRVELKQVYGALQKQLEPSSEPDLFHADGRRKSDQELWEESLRCMYSQDTGNCVCRESGGDSVELEPGKCQSLAERGSVLKQ